MAVLTGLGNYKQVILLNIWGNILGTVMSAILIWKYNTNGALLGLILFQSVFFLFSFYIVYRRFPGLPFLNWKYFDHTLLLDFFSYSLMTLVTASTGPFIVIGIRTKLTDDFGINIAGFWDSVNRISGFYLLFATAMLTVYFFPKLSAAKTDQETKSVFLSYYKSIVPLFAVGLTAIYFLRDFIVRLLFTEDFLPMENLFFWQLFGDFFKVCSLILGYEFFAKKLTKAYIAAEVMSFIILYISSFILIDKYGSEGAVMAHAFTYFIYFIVLAIYFRRKLK
jgi:PST family polysaccharide transporter